MYGMDGALIADFDVLDGEHTVSYPHSLYERRLATIQGTGA